LLVFSKMFRRWRSVWSSTLIEMFVTGLELTFPRLM